MGKNKIIVGRNQKENKFLVAHKAASDFYFELPTVMRPNTLLQGPKTKQAIKIAAELTAFYSNAKESEVLVKFGRGSLDRYIKVELPTRDTVDKLRVGYQKPKLRGT